MKLHHVALIILLVLSACLRLSGITSNYPYSIYPDEGHVVRPAMNMYRERSLDPRKYWHNTLLMTSIDAVVRIVVALTPGADAEAFRRSIKVMPITKNEAVAADLVEPAIALADPPLFLVVGRVLVALAGTAAIAVVYWLLHALVPAWPALAGATAFAALPVLALYGHFVVGDVPMMLAYAGVFAASVRWFLSARWQWLIAALCCCGAAASFKMTGVLSLGLPILLIAGSSLSIRSKILWLVLAPLVAYASLHVLCPGLFGKDRELIANLRFMSAYYGDRTGSRWQHVLQLIGVHNVGFPLLALALAGLVSVAISRSLRRLAVIIVCYVLLYLAVFSRNGFQPVRSMFPLLPLLVFGMTWGAWHAATRLGTVGRRVAFPMLMLGLAVWCGSRAVVEQRRFFAFADPRITLVAWLERHVPQGQVVTVGAGVQVHPQVVRECKCQLRVLTPADHDVAAMSDWVVAGEALGAERDDDPRQLADDRALLAALRASDRKVALEIDSRRHRPLLHITVFSR